MHKTISARKTATISILFLSFLFLSSFLKKKFPGESSMYVSHYENVLGTSMELKIAATSQSDAQVAEKAAIAEIGRLSKILSAYDPASEFSAWLKTSGQPIRVSKELFEVLNLFELWKKRTHGALDASAEVIGQVWKHAGAEQRMPTQTELSNAVEEVKQVHWQLDPQTQTATHLSKVPLMLNSFAKSYIIKKAAEAAKAATKINAIVVNIGGDLVIEGNLKEKVQITDPTENTENDLPIDRLQIQNRAIATSGNYRRGELINGHWYSHIVDPRTGMPADEIISATVIAPAATDAGALATTFNILPVSESIQLASSLPDVDFLIVTKDKGRIQSKGWEKFEIAGKGNEQLVHEKKMNATGFDAYELLVNLEINLQKETFVKRPYVAVWVEDANHAAVRTVALWHERDRYLPELKAWYLKYRGIYSTDKSVLGSVSGATRSAGKYSVKWDGKDDNGNMVKPGNYIIKIEISREHGTYQLIRQEIECNETPKLINLTGNVEIAAASLDYRKKQ